MMLMGSDDTLFCSFNGHCPQKTKKQNKTKPKKNKTKQNKTKKKPTTKNKNKKKKTIFLNSADNKSTDEFGKTPLFLKI